MNKPSNQFNIAGREVGHESPVYVIAELSANHNNSLETALLSVEAAAKAGADAIKVQTYSAESMTLDSDRAEFMARADSLWSGTRLFDLYRTGALPRPWHHELSAAASANGIAFFSAPFDCNAVDFLEDVGVPAYKIASLEITDIPLIRAAASTGKPIILSAGIATEQDIDLAVETCLGAGNPDIALLQCTTQYPTQSNAVDLQGIAWFRDQKRLIPGLSDHTNGSTAAIGAVALGACLVEKHFVLDSGLDTLDKEFSLDPDGLAAYIATVRETEIMRGPAGYNYSRPKQSARQSTRSLIAVQDIPVGDTISPDNVRSLRPNLGLSPRYADLVYGTQAIAPIQRGDGIQWAQINATPPKDDQ